ncbi:hypothetical protein [Baekduia sp. Peel2402]|uniref:hypothetical protein n=1 Tax=Baekduia sp. Peel2402 TaxID=3458296 RepID=UPI00403EDF4C
MSDLVPPYEPYPVHRNNAPDKSQWSITLDEERTTFARAWDNDWIGVDSEVAWGIHAENGEPALELGVSADGERQLWWAKFVGKRVPWHGYPADIVRRQRGDAPEVRILREWHKQGHISKLAIDRVLRKKPCRPM